MLRAVIVPILVLSFSMADVLQAKDIQYEPVKLRVSRYDVDYHIDFEKETLAARCGMTIYNPTLHPIDTIPLLLYRLLSVDSIFFKDGSPLRYAQTVETFDDWDVMQQNFVRVTPDSPLKADDSIQIIIYYSGHLLGYTETGMLYVRDHIDTSFTILRPDCSAYPTLGVPSWKANRAAGSQEFNYTVIVNLPEPLVAANGGALRRKVDLGDSCTYRFENTKPAWRIDLAIARYETIKDGYNTIYHFPEHRRSAIRIAGVVETTRREYTEWWGPIDGGGGFTIIEIPDGWGSQTDVTSIIQTAAAFEDSSQTYQLYHEISHQWHPASLDSFPPRWEEGFAMFAQYLTMDKIDGDSTLDGATARFLQSVKKELTESPNLKELAWIDFGRHNKTDLSYNMGLLAFRLMYDLMGEDQFNAILGAFFRKYRETGATTLEFADYLKSNSTTDLARFVDDWILGSGYSKVLLDSDDWSQVTAAYK